MKGIYKHYKNGKSYEVLGIVLDATTDKEMILYKPLYETNYEYFSRTKEDFFNLVIIAGEKYSVQRFKKIE